MQTVDNKEIAVSEPYHNLFENYKNLFGGDRTLSSVTQCRTESHSPVALLERASVAQRASLLYPVSVGTH